MEDKINIGLASDYAVMEREDLYFYYGYEECFKEEWCFVVKDKDNNKIIYRKTRTELEKSCNGFENENCILPEKYLLVGMMLFTETLIKKLKKSLTI